MTLSIKSIKQSAAIAAIVGAFALSLSSAVGAADWIQGNINMFGYGGDRYEVAQSKNLENVYRTFQIADAKDYLIPCRSGGRFCLRGISSGELSYVKVFNVVDQMQFARFNNQGTYFVSANLTKNASSTWGDFIYLAVQSLIVCNGVSYVGPWSITNQGSVGGGSNSFISAACPYGVFPNAAQAGFYHGVGNSGQ